MSKLLLSPSIQSPIGVFVTVSQETAKAYLISYPAGKLWIPKKILNRQNGKRKVDPETKQAHDYLLVHNGSFFNLFLIYIKILLKNGNCR